MVHSLPHYHNLYADDNMKVYIHIFDATLGTQYSATIVPFKPSRNIRGEYLAIKYQFARPACWYQEIKDKINF